MEEAYKKSKKNKKNLITEPESHEDKDKKSEFSAGGVAGAPAGRIVRRKKSKS